MSDCKFEWCEHVKKDEYFVGGFKVLIDEETKEHHSVENWKFCPICGAKRPERKGLKDKMKEVYIEQSPDWVNLNTFSNVAIDHACEVIDSVCGNRLYTESLLYLKDKLKQSLRESI